MDRPLPSRSTPTLTAADHRQLRASGIAPAEAERQLALLTDPPAPQRLLRPARIDDGIRQLPEVLRRDLIRRYDHGAAGGEVTKLVPASGAASRMFRDLLPWLDGEPGGEAADEVLAGLERLPFYEPLVAAARQLGRELEDLRRGDLETLGRLLLSSEGGLGYADFPKGLIPFHRYPDAARTAGEEHLVEAAAYGRDRAGRCRLHFTVAAEHEAAFRRLLASRGRSLGERLGSRFEVGFSRQSPATDTLALDTDGRPFRRDDGTLLLRPGGHGALIGNLGDLGRHDARVVLIKNIDNVVPEHRLATVVRWKKLLGGLLMELRDRVFACLRELEEPNLGISADTLDRAAVLAAELGRPLPESPAAGDDAAARHDALVDALVGALDRPLRVCGMVRNEGEPGGGPFWVDGEAGPTLQIVEGAQIDRDDREQAEILAASTHFNPVDLACSLVDRRGRPYDLERWIDPSAVILAAKSFEGRPLTALERPGLWNGAMAGWNTVFVEVPAETFAPVKTVADLLRPAHQPPL